MKYSTIIKNGFIVDGTGNKAPYQADLGIKKEKIEKIGDLKNEKADLVLDATDLYISPGFIDITTHSDKYWTIFSEPTQESFLRQGITTIIGGHGGSSLSPIIKKESLEPLSMWLDVSQINTNWKSTKEFLDEVEEKKLSINFATFVGHETLRKNILGNKPQASKEELEKINNLLEKSLEDGSFGLSVNFGTQYSYENSKKELLKLFNTVAQKNTLVSYHITNEGSDLLPSVSKIISLARETKIKSHIAHLKALGKKAWGEFEKALDMVGQAQKEGLKISCDFFPYTSTGSNLAEFLPIWFLRENKEGKIKILKDKNNKQALIDHLETLTLHYEKIIIASAKQKRIIGKSINQISQNTGLSEEETLLSILETSEFRATIFNNTVLEKNIDILSKKPYSMVSSNGIGYSKIHQHQGTPHPRSFGAFPKALRDFVINKNNLRWETAVYKMTGLPAQTLNINNRGTLEEGSFADIVVFNPIEINGAPNGIPYVFVNGALTLAENSLTKASEGKVIRKKTRDD